MIYIVKDEIVKFENIFFSDGSMQVLRLTCTVVNNGEKRFHLRQKKTFFPTLDGDVCLAVA